jgi:hypothetical protein
VHELLHNHLSGSLDTTDPAPPLMEEWQRLNGWYSGLADQSIVSASG